VPTSTFRLFSAVLSVQLALGFALHAAPAEQADRIVVTKSTHTMVLYDHDKVLRTYKVALGRATGRKLRQGDNRTPEGHYRIVAHNLNSAAHLSLHISYPNADDRARSLAARVPPGGDIMIHGLPNGSGSIGAAHTQTDWTFGCIAVTDEEMDEIYRLVPNKTPIDIRP
jgi:murein L,D-transpeptidase YafK